MSVGSIQPLKAAVWMVGTVFSFSAMAIGGREAGVELDTFEIMTYRSILGLIIISSIMALRREIPQMRDGAFGLHLIRNVLHFAATNLWFYAVTTITLAQVFAFEFTTPLWTALLAPLFLGEHLNKIRIFATIVGFSGILVITRPGLVEFSPGMAAAICCALGFAGAAIATRKLVSNHSVITILFWMCTTQTMFSIICAGIDFDIAFPSSQIMLPLVMVSLCGLSAHYCLAKALQLAPATLVMPMDFARLPLIAVLGLLLYQESIDIFMAVGSCLIIYANYINIQLSRG